MSGRQLTVAMTTLPTTALAGAVSSSPRYSSIVVTESAWPVARPWSMITSVGVWSVPRRTRSSNEQWVHVTRTRTSSRLIGCIPPTNYASKKVCILVIHGRVSHWPLATTVAQCQWRPASGSDGRWPLQRGEVTADSGHANHHHADSDDPRLRNDDSGPLNCLRPVFFQPVEATNGRYSLPLLCAT